MSIEKGLKELEQQGVTDIFLVPLYPHYAMSSYETVVEKAKELISNGFKGMTMDVLP